MKLYGTAAARVRGHELVPPGFGRIHIQMNEFQIEENV
jgi:hypothetical protein